MNRQRPAQHRVKPNVSAIQAIGPITRCCTRSPIARLIFSGLLTIAGGCALASHSSGKLEPLVQRPAQAAKLCWNTVEELERSGDLRQAVALYEQARLLDPHAGDYSDRLARLYDRLNQDQAAEREYEAAVARSPDDADLLNDYGVFHLRREQWATAEPWFRQALATNPDHERAAVNLAICVGMQGRLAESYEGFTRIVGPAAAHCNLAVLLQRQGQTEAAAEHFARALRIDPSLETARQGLAKDDSICEASIVSGS